MKSQFAIVDAVCFWCEKPKECVEVEIKEGQSVDLCWACLRKRAKSQNDSRSKNSTGSANTVSS